MRASRQFLMKLKEKAPYLMVGTLIEKTVFNGFDYILYPFMIWKYGLVIGGGIMSILSLIANYFTIIIYDKTKKDWFGIEWIKELKEYSGTSRYLRTLSWILNRGKIIVMILLSVYTNPFTTTAYMRKGVNKFNGIDGKGWVIFFTSWFIANLEWMLMVFAGVSVFKGLWKLFAH